MIKIMIITNNYPYGNGEEFIETEIAYLSKYFDHIQIMSLSDSSIITRKIPDNASAIRITEKLNIFKKIISLRALLSKMFVEELLIIKKKYSIILTFEIVKIMLSNIAVADIIIKNMNIYIGNYNKQHEICLYSYWMNQSALAIAKYKNINKNICAVCRVHGYDLYFERNRNNYLPFRKYITENMDKIFAISKRGKKYLEKIIDSNDCNKIIVSRLGINNYFKRENYRTNYYMHVVSCSYIVDVKRINLIIDAISMISDIKIRWTHIGDGDLRPIIEKYAAEKLDRVKNIEYYFLGHLRNKEVYNFYENNYIDCFINVSESEGIPVSIMEALSFSIPVIATDVGGVDEIVNERNGILLSINPKISEIRDSILKLYNLSHEEANAYRKNAYGTWSELYNAEKNYTEFISIIMDSMSNI